MAFDRKRGVTVMFGGEGLGPRAFADTWEWDGSNWQERTSGAAPPARLGSLIYDTRQEACLLFTRAQPRKDLDPLGNELWRWDGNTWMRLEPPVMPPLTYNFCMAYDEERRKTVLLLEPHGKAFDPLQTWEFDGTEWRRIATEMTPASREGASISYDARRKRIVLHGGRTWSGRMDDTWLYDGTNWSEHIHVERPTPAGQCAMCYDSARRVTMLLADHWELNQPRVRHWQWDGREWRLVYEFGQDAPAIGGGRLAFDSVRGVAVYLSQDVSRGLDNALWEWDGKSWRKVVSDPEKVPKGGVLWFWNPARSCVSLLYGTFNGDVPAGIGSMWHWNGAKWMEEKLENRITDEGRDWVYGYDALRDVAIVHCCYVDRGKDEDWKTPGVTATWELRERWWRKVTASREAPKAGNLTLCFCAGSGELVSFGGGYTILADPSTAYNSTWTWNGSEWRQHLTKTTPPGRAGTVMCYDSDRQVIVMFGGNAAHEQLHDTWEYGPDRP